MAPRSTSTAASTFDNGVDGRTALSEPSPREAGRGWRARSASRVRGNFTSNSEFAFTPHPPRSQLLARHPLPPSRGEGYPRHDRSLHQTHSSLRFFRHQCSPSRRRLSFVLCHPISANAAPPGGFDFFGGRRAKPSLSVSPKREGSEAPKGAGAERRTPWPALRSIIRDLTTAGRRGHNMLRQAGATLLLLLSVQGALGHDRGTNTLDPWRDRAGLNVQQVKGCAGSGSGVPGNPEEVRGLSYFIVGERCTIGHRQGQIDPESSG